MKLEFTEMHLYIRVNITIMRFLFHEVKCINVLTQLLSLICSLYQTEDKVIEQMHLPLNRIQQNTT